MGRIETAHLFLPLHQELIALLRSLEAAAWDAPTAAGRWRVRDVAAHLLDGDVRKLSAQRDGVGVAPAQPLHGWADLVAFLNELNASWVQAARRISPRLLIQFLEVTGAQVASLVESLNPDAPALYPVAWAGDDVSPNWFDTAREYTERWHHQAQIRDAVGAAPLYEKRWMHPVLDAFVRALPHRYRSIEAPEGSMLLVVIECGAGGEWTMIREAASWRLWVGRAERPNATVTVSAKAAWKLFTKDSRAAAQVRLEGNHALAEPFLTTVAVMA